MQRLKQLVLAVSLVLVFGYAAYEVYTKERTIREGELILLRLAPVDPRSLMQGDYMELRYAISTEAEAPPRRGFLVLARDERGVGRFVRVQAGREPLRTGEHLIRFVRRSAGAGQTGRLSIGAEQFFFQEGRAERFAGARYGGLRLDGRGGSVLVGLYDEDARLIR
ncbi:GDYXXLXY domain-containing protein [Lewinella sp. JB7]|uniref:GDYXXLXY domain-containing protein n=1 Tax=Lewinella sp. JB7 TaxID=2962887 RepID=UPI0020C9B2BA|nr:GDYXXLXY domain-containing protein [Lewinella sp. JB7]